MDVPPTDNSAVDGYAVDSVDIPAAGRASSRSSADLAAGARLRRRAPPGAGAPHHDGRARCRPAPTPCIRRRSSTREGSRVVVPADRERRQRAASEARTYARGPSCCRRAPCCDLRSWASPPRSVCSQLLVQAEAARGHPLHRRRGRRAGRTCASRVRSTTPTGSRSAASWRRQGARSPTTASCPIVFDELRARLLEAAGSADIVLTSGGVSVGDYDLVKAVLQDVGAHRLLAGGDAARPPDRGRAASGPPTSSVCPATPSPACSPSTSSCGRRSGSSPGAASCSAPRFRAVAIEPMRKKVGRREFKRGILTYTGERWEVRTTGPQGSGILTSMTYANCLIVFEEERGDVAAGETRVGRAVRHRSDAEPRVPHAIETELIERITPLVDELATSRARALAASRLRGCPRGRERGQVRRGRERRVQILGRRLRVRLRHPRSRRAIAWSRRDTSDAVSARPTSRDPRRGSSRKGSLAAYRRAMANAELQGRRAETSSAASARRSPTRASARSAVRAGGGAGDVFEIDPRAMSLDEMVRFTDRRLAPGRRRPRRSPVQLHRRP